MFYFLTLYRRYYQRTNTRANGIIKQTGLLKAKSFPEVNCLNELFQNVLSTIWYKWNKHVYFDYTCIYRLTTNVTYNLRKTSSTCVSVRDFRTYSYNVTYS